MESVAVISAYKGAFIRFTDAIAGGEVRGCFFWASK